MGYDRDRTFPLGRWGRDLVSDPRWARWIPVDHTRIWSTKHASSWRLERTHLSISERWISLVTSRVHES